MSNPKLSATADEKKLTWTGSGSSHVSFRDIIVENALPARLALDSIHLCQLPFEPIGMHSCVVP
jgi:hypothetical protein